MRATRCAEIAADLAAERFAGALYSDNADAEGVSADAGAKGLRDSWNGQDHPGRLRAHGVPGRFELDDRLEAVEGVRDGLLVRARRRCVSHPSDRLGGQAVD